LYQNLLSAKQTPQSSNLTNLHKKVYLSELSNLSRKSNQKGNTKYQVPRVQKYSHFKVNHRKPMSKKSEKKSNKIDLRFMNSDLESEQSEKNSFKNITNSSFNKNKKNQKLQSVNPNRIQNEFMKNFPDQDNMSPTSKFQNKFFARKTFNN
jgi:hypothetical protein